MAGVRGGSGKTTLSLGLCAAFRQMGLGVSAFKKGPDYIDAGWLASASGSPCYNLDPFLIGEKTVMGSFLEHSAGSDVAVIEGNRGVFDGMDVEGSFSTARVSRVLKCPVLLVLDCSKTTRTAAALVLGVKRFEAGLRLGGVVLNRVAGSRHEGILRLSIEKYTGVPVVGALPSIRYDHLPERHMGLVPFHEHSEVEDAVKYAAEFVKRYVDLKAVLRMARGAPYIGSPRLPAWREVGPEGMPRIGVIKDTAFQFYYPENLDALREAGASVVEFSALAAKSLPAVDALYIGGGFPETHAVALSANKPFMRSLRRAVEDGLPVYAECGGLMYLGQRLVIDGRTHRMAGILPAGFQLYPKPQAHGYTIVKVSGSNPFYRKGTVLRGHEFHYSRAGSKVGEGCAGEPYSFAFRMKRGVGIGGGMDGLCYKNVLGTYTHVHALGSPEWAAGMVKAATRFRAARAGKGRRRN